MTPGYAIRKVYGAVESSLNAGGVLRGALFWEWLADGELATETGIRVTDSTWQCAAALCVPPEVPDCRRGSARGLDPAVGKACRSTRPSVQGCNSATCARTCGPSSHHQIDARRVGGPPAGIIMRW